MKYMDQLASSTKIIAYNNILFFIRIFLNSWLPITLSDILLAVLIASLFQQNVR